MEPATELGIRSGLELAGLMAQVGNMTTGGWDYP